MSLNSKTRTALHYLCPYNTIVGLDKVRLGSESDGGYVIVNDFNNVDTLLSFGVGHNVDFEQSALSHGIKKVIMYDHTVNGTPIQNTAFEFNRVAVGKYTDPSNNIRSLQDIVAYHKLDNNFNILLKCDIEDAELDMIEGAPDHIWNHFAQIVIEYHWLEHMVDESRLDRVSACWEKLSRTHSVVHIHGNNYGPVSTVNELLLPQAIEVTYLRNDRAELVPSNEVFPSPLDRKNNPGCAEIILGNFRFL